MSSNVALQFSTDANETIINYRLSKDILSDNIHYYFTLLDPRFFLINNYVCATLNKIVKKNVKPIFVSANKATLFNPNDNYIIANKKLKADNINLQVIKGSNTIEINKDFSNSNMIINLLKELYKKQGRVYINSFSTSFMNIEDKYVKFIGPDPIFAKYLDSKINQREFFKNLSINVPRYSIYKNLHRLKEDFRNGLIGPSYISAEYSSGGKGTRLVRNLDEIEKFYNSLNDFMVMNRFIASSIIDVKYTPNSSGLVLAKNNVFISSISDQILDGTKYMGNVYPSTVPESLQNDLVETARKIGLELSRNGYRGFYGCDWIIDKSNNIFAVDLNPRKQGGYLCNFLMFEKIKDEKYPSLVELEIRATEGEEIDYDLRKYENPKIGYYWAHSKIPPNYNTIIKKVVHEGNEMEPFDNMGKSYIKSFYSTGYQLIKGDKIGQIIATDINRKTLLTRLIKLREQTKEVITPSIKYSFFKNKRY